MESKPENGNGNLNIYNFVLKRNGFGLKRQIKKVLSNWLKKIML